MNEDKANSLHPSYSAQQAKRDVFRAVYGGTDTIRAGSEKYLPKYPAESTTEYDIRRNASTIDGIVLGGVDTLCGSVFEDEIDVSGVHQSLQEFLENVDNKGNSFNIFSRDAFRESFDGFSCILVDMPNAKARDAEEEKNFGIRPYLNLYCAANVINWRHQVNPISKQLELVLLVLKEVSSEPDGRFKFKDVTRYRVFEMRNGLVTWELWREDKKGSAASTITSELVLEASGAIEKVNQIPVAFIGDVMADPKLLVESRLEIRAYQKESSFDVIEYLSIPVFYTIGYESDEPLKIGANTHIKIPNPGNGGTGEGGFAQIDSAGHISLKGTISDIKSLIKSRVNYLVDSASAASANPDKTATQVVTEDKDKQARLVVWADELKDALETALMYMGQFIGLGEDEAGEIVLKTKWAVAAEQEQMQKDFDSQIITEEMEIKRLSAEQKAKAK